MYVLPYEEYPSWRQATEASLESQLLSQSVVHVLSTHNSTRPVLSSEDPLNLTSPSIQGSMLR